MTETKPTKVEGNAAGWVGFRPDPKESKHEDVRFTEAREPYDFDYHIKGLLPYETVLVVLEGGQFRQEARVVADEFGKIGVSFTGDVARDSYGLGVAVNVGDEGTVELQGEFVEFH